jgi:hypothetical protein
MQSDHPWLNEAVWARVGRRGRRIEDFVSPEAAEALEEIADSLMEGAGRVSSGAIQGALTPSAQISNHGRRFSVCRCGPKPAKGS